MKVSEAIVDLRVKELKRLYRVALKKEEEERILEKRPYNKPASKKYKDKIYTYLLEKGFSTIECVQIFNKA
jgi:SOS response regulatory protein OraA/RecX